MAEIPYSIEVTLDRFESDDAILRTSNGQEIMWPSSEIPDDLEEGSVVRLALLIDDEMLDDRRLRAQDVLNEIFSDEEDR